MIILRETYKGIPIIYIDESPERHSYQPTSDRLDSLYGNISTSCFMSNIMDLIMARGQEQDGGARYAFL